MEVVDAVVVVATSTTRRSQERRRGSKNRGKATLAATRRTLMWWRYQKGSGLYQRWVRPRFSATPMFWALIMWLCSFPLLALLAAPFLGWKITAYLAGFLLVADLVMCWSICRVRVPRDPIICAKCLNRLYKQVQRTQAPKADYQKKTV